MNDRLGRGIVKKPASKDVLLLLLMVVVSDGSVLPRMTHAVSTSHGKNVLEGRLDELTP